MEFDYEQSTSKCLPSPYDNKSDNGMDESREEIRMCKEDLAKLISFMENELDSRDDLIRRLKEERTKHLLYEAKYGRITAGDPFVALRRDSDVTGEKLDEEEIGELYESQLVQLEKLITVHKKSHSRAKMILSSTERRHAKALRELELEKERKSAYAAQGDDVVAFLEREREKLQQRLDFQINEVSSAKKETEKLERRLEQEKEKHKSMILFLINERKQMLVKMHELRIKGENVPSSSLPIDAGLVDELRKEINFLRQERDQLKGSNKAMKAETLSLKEVVKGQETDLLSLRRNMISTNKLHMEKPSIVTITENSLVVANRMASVPQPPRGTRLSNSSSFPSEKSRLPRAPESPARTPVSNVPRPLTSPRAPPSPTKKTPAMGIGMGTVRQRPPPSVVSSVPKYSNDPELQQLEDAIQGLEQQVTGVGGSPTKRSSSLTRGKSEPRKDGAPNPVVYRTEPGGRPSTVAGIRPPAKVEKPQERKLSGTIKKSSLLKAFGAGK